MHLVEKLGGDRKPRLVTEYAVDITAGTHRCKPMTTGPVVNPSFDGVRGELGAAMKSTAELAGLDLGAMADRGPVRVSDWLREAINRVHVVGLPHGFA